MLMLFVNTPFRLLNFEMWTRPRMAEVGHRVGVEEHVELVVVLDGPYQERVHDPDELDVVVRHPAVLHETNVVSTSQRSVTSLDGGHSHVDRVPEHPARNQLAQLWSPSAHLLSSPK